MFYLNKALVLKLLISLNHSWTRAASFTFHLHVDTFSQATVEVSIPIHATDRLVLLCTDTGAWPFMSHLHVGTISLAAVGVGFAILSADRSVVLSTETVVLIIARPLMCHLCVGTIRLASVGVGLAILSANWLKDL